MKFEAVSNPLTKGEINAAALARMEVKISALEQKVVGANVQKNVSFEFVEIEGVKFLFIYFFLTLNFVCITLVPVFGCDLFAVDFKLFRFAVKKFFKQKI